MTPFAMRTLIFGCALSLSGSMRICDDGILAPSSADQSKVMFYYRNKTFVDLIVEEKRTHFAKQNDYFEMQMFDEHGHNITDVKLGAFDGDWWAYGWLKDGYVPGNTEIKVRKVWADGNASGMPTCTFLVRDVTKRTARGWVAECEVADYHLELIMVPNLGSRPISQNTTLTTDFSLIWPQDPQPVTEEQYEVAIRVEGRCWDALRTTIVRWGPKSDKVFWINNHDFPTKIPLPTTESDVPTLSKGTTVIAHGLVQAIPGHLAACVFTVGDSPQKVGEVVTKTCVLDPERYPVPPHPAFGNWARNWPVFTSVRVK